MIVLVWVPSKAVWDKTAGTSDFLEGDSRKQGGGNQDSKKRKKETSKSVCITNLPTVGNEDLIKWGPFEKHTQWPSRPELCTWKTGGWNIYPLCSVPHWLRVEFRGVHIPTPWVLHRDWTGACGIRESHWEESRKTHGAWCRQHKVTSYLNGTVHCSWATRRGGLRS